MGQNLAIKFNSAQQDEAAVQRLMTSAAQNWYDEVTDPGFDSQTINPFMYDNFLSKIEMKLKMFCSDLTSIPGTTPSWSGRPLRSSAVGWSTTRSDKYQ